MTNVFSLDDLRNDLDTIYNPIEIDGVQLRNLMRLSKDERAKVLTAFARTKDADTNTPEGIEEMLSAVHEMIAVVGGKGGPGLVKKIGDDLALAVRIMELWTEATQPGEAGNSPV